MNLPFCFPLNPPLKPRQHRHRRHRRAQRRACAPARGPGASSCSPQFAAVRVRVRRTSRFRYAPGEDTPTITRRPDVTGCARITAEEIFPKGRERTVSFSCFPAVKGRGAVLAARDKGAAPPWDLEFKGAIGKDGPREGALMEV